MRGMKATGGNRAIRSHARPITDHVEVEEMETGGREKKTVET